MDAQLSGMESLKAEVIEARRKAADEKTTRELAESMLHQSEEWDAFTSAEEAERQALEKANEAEEKLRAATLIYFQDHPEDKKPLEGVEVKIFHRPIYEIPKAFGWCTFNAPALIEKRLNVKAFEKSAEDLGVPEDICRFENVPRVYLAKDLK
jgi:hypothetical protein